MSHKETLYEAALRIGREVGAKLAVQRRLAAREAMDKFELDLLRTNPTFKAPRRDISMFYMKPANDMDEFYAWRQRR